MLTPFFCSTQSRKNPFDSKEMAKHYDRPDTLYTGYIQHVARILKIESPVEDALDVACGTGVSTHALKLIAKRIIGVDASENMLANAKKDDKIEYKLAIAEKLPFHDAKFDLVSIRVAFHCINQEIFLKEAARVLRDNGNLIICHSKFKGIETSQFSNWFNKVFYKKYPLVPGRREYSPNYNKSDDFSSDLGMHYSEFIDLDIKQFSQLLMTTSGVFLAVERDKEKREKIEEWLTQELKPFFENKNKVSFRVDMSIWCLKRIPRPELIYI